MPDMNPNNLPDDVETLKALLLASQQALDITREQSTTKISELSAKNEKLAHSLLAKSQQLAVLEQQLAALRRARFGKSSEKLDVSIYQMELMIEDLESTVAELGPEASPEPKKKQKTPNARQSLPESLPRETRTHDSGSCCDECGHTLSLIGEDVSEQLEYKPASFRVIRHVRPKYRCDGCDSLVQAAPPSKPILKSYAGPALLAHIAVAKFCDHLPLYRQSAIYSREGVELS